MDDDKLVLALVFFGFLAFLAFISRPSTATTTPTSSPLYTITKDEQGRVILVDNYQPF
jgi:hypothetical protein